MATALIIGVSERQAIADLRERAAASPVNMPDLMARIETPDGKAAHMRQMSAQTVCLPVAYAVTFSIETGHPIGVVRHMSMSVNRRLPRPEAAWMVAQELGFWGSIKDCTVWREKLQGHGEAVNLVQPIAGSAEGHA